MTSSPRLSVVPIKGKLMVRATIDAPGFENSTVRVRLLLNDKEEKSQDATLKLTHGNQISLECDAPDKPGEVKVTVRVESPMANRRCPAS